MSYFNRVHYLYYRRLFLTTLSAALGLAATPGGLPALQAQSLYEAGAGTLPESQGWVYAASITASETWSGAALLNTTATSLIQAGWTDLTAGDLNHTNGYTLAFTVQVNAESHGSANRAGFSVIVLSDDKLGLELGFWTNTIFAQSDAPLFTHAEDVSFVTTTSAIPYTLTLLATNYILQANGTPILTGPIRNYTAFSGFPNPYRTPNLIFLGDDSTSSAASWAWSKAAILFPVKLSAAASGTFSWTGVSNYTYRVQSSTDLLNWSALGTASSTNNNFQFTPARISSQQFYRVVCP